MSKFDIRPEFECQNRILNVRILEIQLEFLYVHDLGPRSRNDLDLQYSYIFIYSIRYLLLLYIIYL